jgi:hypothetical protein
MAVTLCKSLEALFLYPVENPAGALFLLVGTHEGVGMAGVVFVVDDDLPGAADSAYFGAWLPVISDQGYQPFRSMVTSDFGLMMTTFSS